MARNQASQGRGMIIEVAGDKTGFFMHAQAVNWTYVLIAHGTISSIDELPEFLLEIRRGRPVPDELLHEMRDRYEQIGHSPLLEHTEAQARALAELSGHPARVAMRLSAPRLLEVVSDLGPEDGICLIPMAPFSVGIYAGAARRELEKLTASRRPKMVAVEPWGADPRLIEAYVEGISSEIESRLDSEERQRTQIILTAHSLPEAIVRAGDKYADLFSETAGLVGRALALPTRRCYQSQGADGADWLGPTLADTMKKCAEEGTRTLVVAPIGFLAEHIETLYDLDIEAKSLSASLGLELIRVPTLGTAPKMIQTLNDAAERAIEAATIDPRPGSS